MKTTLLMTMILASLALCSCSNLGGKTGWWKPAAPAEPGAEYGLLVSENAPPPPIEPSK